MIKKAEQFAAEDKVKRDRIETVNQAENILNDTESKMEEYKDQLPKEEVNARCDKMLNDKFECDFCAFQCDKMREEIQKVREALANKDNIDPEEMRKTTSALQQSSLKLFELAYKKMASERESSGTSSSSDSQQSTDSQDETKKKEDKN
jgi:molecular chaperone DnaK